MDLFSGIATDTLFKSPALQEAQRAALSSISADLFRIPALVEAQRAAVSAIGADLVSIPAVADGLSAECCALELMFPLVAADQPSTLASFSSDLSRIPDVTANLSAQVVAPAISAARANTDFAARVSGMWRISDELRTLFTRIIEFRRRISSRLADLRRPAKVEGLQQNLDPFRRRLSVAVESISHAHMRAMLARRQRAGDAPGKLLISRPQIARGPNTTRRSIRTSQSPAGLLHV